MSYLGIFWYNEATRTLEGVYALPEEEVAAAADGSKFFPLLHKDIWVDRHYACFDRYGDVLPGCENSIFLGADYTLVPRGRVSRTSEGYLVYIGDWIDSDFEYISGLIREKFELPYFGTKFEHKIHWQIGQGWGE